jgi:hypothetical protein
MWLRDGRKNPRPTLRNRGWGTPHLLAREGIQKQSKKERVSAGIEGLLARGSLRDAGGAQQNCVGLLHCDVAALLQIAYGGDDRLVGGDPGAF